MRNDVLLHCVLEEGRRREVDSEKEEWGVCFGRISRNIKGGFSRGVETEADVVLVDDHYFLSFDDECSLEGFVYYTCYHASQMSSRKETGGKRTRIGLLRSAHIDM